MFFDNCKKWPNTENNVERSCRLNSNKHTQVVTDTREYTAKNGERIVESK